VVRRFATLAARERGRDPEAVDAAIVRAFDRLIRRRRVDGRLGDGTAAEGLERALVDGFVGLYDSDLDRPPTGRVREAVVTQFQRLYYHSPKQTWKNTFYRGTTVWKCPMDLWAYQEIAHEARPDLIIETGTAFGGSGHYLADLCETLGHGRVVTIDIRQRPARPEHPRLTYLTGSSTDPEVVAQVEQISAEVGPTPVVLVILDSDHSREHVLAELRTWSSWVPVGSYVLVEDTNINGHPVYPEFGPGPAEAVQEFLADDDRFVVDVSLESRMLTFNPGGFLKRIR
jgi:cephalosporin hydroxylase